MRQYYDFIFKTSNPVAAHISFNMTLNSVGTAHIILSTTGNFFKGLNINDDTFGGHLVLMIWTLLSVCSGLGAILLGVAAREENRQQQSPKPSYSPIHFLFRALFNPISFGTKSDYCFMNFGWTMVGTLFATAFTLAFDAAALDLNNNSTASETKAYGILLSSTLAVAAISITMLVTLMKLHSEANHVPENISLFTGDIESKIKSNDDDKDVLYSKETEEQMIENHESPSV